MGLKKKKRRKIILLNNHNNYGKHENEKKKPIIPNLYPILPKKNYRKNEDGNQ